MKPSLARRVSMANGQEKRVRTIYVTQRPPAKTIAFCLDSSVGRKGRGMADVNRSDPFFPPFPP